MLRFYDIQILLQEVPDQISLCFSITGCPLRCEGCHSPFLWKKGSGKELSDEVFISYIEKYKNMISCVLFMGGEWEENDLVRKLSIAQAKGLHTCLYTGYDDVSPKIKNQLTWLKTGAWNPKLGGLSSPATNQKFIEIATGKVLNYRFLRA